MIKRWTIYNKSSNFAQISKDYKVDPVIARIIRNRDVLEDNLNMYLHGGIENLNDPFLMKDMDIAVTLLLQTIAKGSKIRIVSDYDVDGVMSNYILYKALRDMGADVDYEIPDRINDGYGINDRIIKAAFDDGINLILTCDNGISAIPQIKYAKDLGMSVIVTDHHDIPYDTDEEGSKVYNYVEADAIVNPKQEDCTYPFKELCGAAVAYKLIEAMYVKMNKGKEDLYQYIEEVAMATICDVVKLQGENRIFVNEGLQSMAYTENIGIRCLLEVNNLEDKRLNSYHFGFVIGPCINATGRLESAKLSMELLLETNHETALEKAEKLKTLNEERKEMTARGVEKAIEQIESGDFENNKVLVVYIPDCHESLAGIIAGRIKDKYYKPTLVITKAEDNLIKGSARSIENYNMYEALTNAKKLLVKYGGHTMAAGFTLFEGNIDSLREKLNVDCELNDIDMQPKVMIDVAMPLEYATIEFVEELQVLEPHGKGNEKPLFAYRNVRVASAKILGANKNVIKLKLVGDTGVPVEGIYFNPEEFTNNMTEWFGYEECDKMLHGWINDISLNITYTPQINTFRDVKSVQLVIKDYTKYNI